MPHDDGCGDEEDDGSRQYSNKWEKSAEREEDVARKGKRRKTGNEERMERSNEKMV